MPSFDSTDLDNATSESGVVHENTANTDYTNASQLQQGYSATTPLFPTNLERFYLFQENSGTTAYDYSGTNNATYNGPTLNSSQFLGASVPEYDGVDDYVSFPFADLTTGYTLAQWVYPTNVTDQNTTIRTSDGGITIIRTDSSQFNYFHNDGSFNSVTSSSISPNTWYLVAQTWDGSTMTGWLGSPTASITSQGSLNLSTLATTTSVDRFGAGDGGRFFDGYIGPSWIYSAALSQSQLQTFYNVVATSGSLTTQFKTV